MSRREVTEPEVDADGRETHPSWVMIGAYRVHATPGVALFGSDVLHQHYVIIKIQTATRKRDLHRDWVHADRIVMEIAMSEAQYASFISTMNSGDGVEATARYLRDGKLLDVPQAPFDSRLELTHGEATTAAHDAFDKIREAFEAFKVKPNAANKRALEIAIQHAVPNVDFAADKLNEHAETVVQKARADIEAMMTSLAAQRGLDAGDVRSPLELEEGQ